MKGRAELEGKLNKNAKRACYSKSTRYGVWIIKNSQHSQVP